MDIREESGKEERSQKLKSIKDLNRFLEKQMKTEKDKIIRTGFFFDKCKRCGEVIETTEAYTNGYKKALSKQAEALKNVEEDLDDKIKKGMDVLSQFAYQGADIPKTEIKRLSAESDGYRKGLKEVKEIHKKWFGTFGEEK